MPIPWNLIIAAIILAFALLIKHVFAERIEDEKPFVWLIAAFLITYLVSAVVMSFLNPMDKISPIFAAQKTQTVEDVTVKL